MSPFSGRVATTPSMPNSASELRKHSGVMPARVTCLQPVAPRAVAKWLHAGSCPEAWPVAQGGSKSGQTRTCALPACRWAGPFQSEPFDVAPAAHYDPKLMPGGLASQGWRSRTIRPMLDDRPPFSWASGDGPVSRRIVEPRAATAGAQRRRHVARPDSAAPRVRHLSVRRLQPRADRAGPVVSTRLPHR